MTEPIEPIVDSPEPAPGPPPVVAPPIRRGRQWLRGLAAGALVLAALEGGLRAVDAVHPLAMLRDARDEGNVRAPRDEASREPSAAGVERVATIGDAAVTGAVAPPLDHASVLERLLTRGGHPARVLDRSVAEAEPSDLPSIFIRDALPTAPDRVLVFVAVGDDLAARDRVQPRYRHSYLARLAHALLAPRRDGGRGASEARPPPVDGERFLALERERSWIFAGPSTRLTDAVNRAIAPLVETKQLADRRRVRLTVVLAPDPAQIDPTVRKRIGASSQAESDSGEHALSRPSELLAGALAQHGIEVVDLTAELARRGARTRLHSPDSIGWNALGSRMAAAIVARDVFHVTSRNPRRPRPSAAPPPTAAGAGATSSRVFEGVHEHTGCDAIRAWAWEPSRPDESVDVDVLDGETLVITQTADVYRGDLLAAGKGDGSHGFELRTPARLRDGEAHTIRLRIAGSSFDLTNTPSTLWCPAP
ncbi:MAG: hypothetical protein U0610_03435 [bacterium]